MCRRCEKVDNHCFKDLSKFKKQKCAECLECVPSVYRVTWSVCRVCAESRGVCVESVRRACARCTLGYDLIVGLRQ